MRKRRRHQERDGVDFKLTMQTDNNKEEVKQYEINDADYWRRMYDELERQMYQMMEMTLDLIDKETGRKDHNQFIRNKFTHEIPYDLEKELRRLQLFEHRIKVTFLGRLTLKYIALKRRLRKLISGK